jgi:hypothetical protein
VPARLKPDDKKAAIAKPVNVDLAKASHVNLINCLLLFPARLTSESGFFNPNNFPATIPRKLNVQLLYLLTLLYKIIGMIEDYGKACQEKTERKKCGRSVSKEKSEGEYRETGFQVTSQARVAVHVVQQVQPLFLGLGQ